MNRPQVPSPTGRAALITFLIGLYALVPTGCSHHYNAALHELALTQDQRYAERAASMQEAAQRAIQSIDVAARSLRSDPADISPRGAARQSRLVNDADAAVFEFSRQVLCVDDVAAGAGPEQAAGTSSLRASMTAAQNSLGAALKSLKDWRAGSASADADGGTTGVASDPAALDRCLEQARADVAAVRRCAQPFIIAPDHQAGTPTTDATGP